MRAITFQAIETLALESVPDPGIEAPTDAVVRVTAAGICGSDLHPYLGRERGIEPGTVMGHELVGEVVAVGAAVSGIALGDRVVAPFTTSCGDCFYCGIGLTARCVHGRLFGWIEGGQGLHGVQAELARVPLASSTLVPVPEGLDDAVAVLAGDVLSTAAYSADLADVHDGDVVVVVGCGPVGLLSIRAALRRGARAVVAVDRVRTRLDLAERFGAVAVDAERQGARAVVDEHTDGRGADAAIEAVGSHDATRAAADLLRFGGRLAAVGVHAEPRLALSPGEIYDRNLRYAAGRCPARHYLPSSLALAERDHALLATVISHRLPLAQGVDAYGRFARREPGWSKVVLLPHADA